MNAVVTGGGGFLGTRIVEMLLARGQCVRVFARHRYPALAELGADCALGDVRDFEAVCAALRGADTVFHTASLAGIWGPRNHFYEVNVKGTANVIRGCLENKVARLVYTSSPSVVISGEVINGDESLPYPRRYVAHYPASKALAEKMVLEANGWEMVVEDRTPFGRAGAGAGSSIRRLRTAALRPHLIWGPRDPHLVPRILGPARAGRLRRIGDGTNKVDLTYVDNAAHAHLQVADELGREGRAAGRAYFIADAEPVLLWDWIDELLENLGVAKPGRTLSRGPARRLGAFLELLHTLLPALGEPPLTRFVAEQLANSHYFSHARAAQDFGYAPLVDSATGMKRLLEWLRSGGPEAESANPPEAAAQTDTSQDAIPQ